MKMTFNHQRPFVTSLPDVGEVGAWPTDDWKYADVEHVYGRTTDLVRRVIDAAPITGRFKRVLIDVKVQDLTPEIFSCIPGWHLDGALPREGIFPDHHHLFVLNGPLTEFIAEPVTLELKGDIRAELPQMIRSIPSDVPVMTCAPNAITTFTSYDFHRGVRAVEPTRRLLVRLTETNSILAHNKPKTPSQGARIGR